MYKLPGAGVGIGGTGAVLASTGANVGVWIVAGIVLVAIGVFLTLASKRNAKLKSTR